MSTGNYPDTAKTIAKDLGALDRVHWALKPEDKAVIAAAGIFFLKSDTRRTRDDFRNS
jgi:hypothetical protein